METLNQIYDNSCKINYKNYKKISNNIVLIDNFFENFELSRNFFISRDKWQCVQFQNHSKPGCESLFPEWVGKSLIQKYILDNKVNDEPNSYSISCNFFYEDSSYTWSLINSNHFPHIDHLETGGILNYICLVNLNKITVSTKFYTYNNNEHCTSDIKEEWNEYNQKISKEILKYYNKELITRSEVKQFLDKKSLKVKIINKVKYEPNQAIIYPANLFHCADVPQIFTENNPRIILRIAFIAKKESNNIKYY